MTVTKVVNTTNIPGKVIETFTTNLSAGGGQDSINWICPKNVNSISYLIVAGGGGGGGAKSEGNATGGGGGGGLLQGIVNVIPGTSYTIKVGAGGIAGLCGATVANGGNGANSEFHTIISSGGGGGGCQSSYGNVGGSGGGGAYSAQSGVTGQGNAGGISILSSPWRGGGGGGAGSAGINGSTSGNGGSGIASSITGTSVTYAGGGGGGCYYSATPGAGGNGGGGTGGNASLAAIAGTNGLGSGGGGAGSSSSGYKSSAAGGSGIVIIQYTIPRKSYGAPAFNSLLSDCVCWFTGLESNEFPIIPSGVTVTPAGTFTKTDLGNNKSVVNFDGSTNYISLADSTSWNIFEANFTIACNVKFTSVAANRIICGQYADANNYWYLGWATSNTLLLIGMVSGSATFSYSCALTPSTSTWYHIIVQRSSSSCLMYIDGISQGVTATTAFTGTTNIAAILNIGLSNTTYMLGLIKDFMTFTRALSLPEIKLLMNRTHPITGAWLMPVNGEYWRLT